MENCIYFKWDNSSEIKSLPIQGVKIQVKDLRSKIESLYNPKKDDFQLQIDERILDISDEARNKQTVNIVRIPKKMNCHSCYQREYEIMTPCCSRQICSNCDSTFSSKSKCFFNQNQQCHYKYSECFQQNVVPEEPLNFNYNSVFYVLRGNRQMIATAKRYSIWTTREMNYLKMSQDFNIPATVILIFINNDEFFGCAKMINQLIPKVPQKTFKIQWLRKQSSPKFVYEFPIDTRDGSKILPGIGKSICYSFPVGQQLVECKPQQQTSPKEEEVVEWDLDEIFRDQEETVKKDENKQEIKEKTTDFNEKQRKDEGVKIHQAVETLSHTQQLFDKLNNGQIPGIKGNVKYAHPLLKTLFLGMIESSLTQLNDQKRIDKKRKHSSRSPSEEMEIKQKSNKSSKSKKSENSSKKEKKQLKIKEKKEQSKDQKNSQRKKIDRDDEINKRIKEKRSRKSRKSKSNKRRHSKRRDNK